MSQAGPHLQEPVTAIARKDFPLLREAMTVGEALASIRQQGVGERIVYFYVADVEGRLVGVIPTRRLLVAPLDRPLREIMVTRIFTVPQTATVLQACEALVLHRFLALPVVDGENRIVGVIDVEMLTDEVVDLAERQQAETTFETLGFRLTQVRDAAPHRAFRFRFPWLLATIASGVACALLLSLFQTTLAESLVLAFFLALVLGLGESVSVQSMSVTVQALRARRPTMSAYRTALRRELLSALMLGVACGGIVALIALIWRGHAAAAAAIGTGILSSLIMACVFGLSVPWLLHALRLDPKIAAGPLTLALTDVTTVVLYLLAAKLML